MEKRIRKTPQDSRYKIHGLMISRCHKPGSSGYANYGGSGIFVCDRWRGPDGYKHFIEDMGERPPGKSLDRINSKKGYSPDNCRWADQRTQCINQGKRKDNTSGYFGVFWHKRKLMWTVAIGSNGKLHHFGEFEDKIEAAKMYDVKARELHGDCAKQNFPLNFS